MRTHIASKCETCVSYDAREGVCLDIQSENYQRNISPFHSACNKHLSSFSVYKKTKNKKWFRAKSMEDLEKPNAKL